MSFLSFVLFPFITIQTTELNTSTSELFRSKRSNFIIAKTDIDNISMNEGAFSLKQGQKITINFTKPYGMILMRRWSNTLLEIFAYNPITRKRAPMESIKQGSSRIGIYFGEYTGSVDIVAIKDTFVSYAHIDFPDDCDHRYISNTLSRTISLKGTNYLDGSTFCYFNTAKLPITYTFNYSLGQDNLQVLTNSNEDVNATEKGYFDKTLSVPAFIKVITGKDIKKKHFVNMKMSSVNDEKPLYKYSGFVNSQSPTYIIGEKKKGSKKLSSSAISTLVVAAIIFFALVVYAFSYLCLSHRHKHRHHHNHDNNNNNNNNTNSRNVNANNNNPNATDNNNNENTEENAEEKEIIENGRYKTPAHVNIELISSQFDQKYKSSNTNLFSRKSSSHFDNDKDLNEDDVENNGYPLNEYKPPSKGILAPTSISQFSENVDEDDEDSYEKKDLENIKEAPFRKVPSNISEITSDSDSD